MELGGVVKMIVVPGKILGQSTSWVVLSEPKRYDLIKIILNAAVNESVHRKHRQWFKNAADRLTDGGTCSPLPDPCSRDMLCHKVPFQV